jgi:hypothetical protein
MQLYTSDTFAPLNPDPAMAALELKGVGDKVGIALTPENTASKSGESGSRSTSPMAVRR